MYHIRRVISEFKTRSGSFRDALVLSAGPVAPFPGLMFGIRELVMNLVGCGCFIYLGLFSTIICLFLLLITRKVMRAQGLCIQMALCSGAGRCVGRAMRAFQKFFLPGKTTVG
jgi:hypothetical protein